MNTPKTPSTIRRWIRFACLGVMSCAAAGSALAQGTPPESWRAGQALQQRAQGALRSSSFASSRIGIVEVGGTAANHRPRHALRLRFDGATRAMRNMGVEADDCNSLVRSSTRRQADAFGGGEKLQLSVSVAVSCSFF